MSVEDFQQAKGKKLAKVLDTTEICQLIE
jgi:hypothetical protein